MAFRIPSILDLRQTNDSQAVAIPHYALIANVLQMTAYYRVNEEYTSKEKRRMKAGDVGVAGMLTSSLYI